jgi:hypothetical protein
VTVNRRAVKDFVFGCCASGNCHACPGTLKRPDIVEKNSNGVVTKVLEANRVATCSHGCHR